MERPQGGDRASCVGLGILSAHMTQLLMQEDPRSAGSIHFAARMGKNQQWRRKQATEHSSERSAE